MYVNSNELGFRTNCKKNTELNITIHIESILMKSKSIPSDK